MSDLIIDPEFQKQLVPLSALERGWLEESILKEGCNVPLVVWQIPQVGGCPECDGEEYETSEWLDEESRMLETRWRCKHCGEWCFECDEVLIDGHNRHEICEANNIRFPRRDVFFANHAEAEEWIDQNQAGRRNLSPDDFKIVSGRIYNRRKKAQGGTGANQHEQRDQVDPSAKTAETVADELGTSAPTIKRNGQRAELHDTFQSEGDSEAAEAVKSVPHSVVADARKLTPEAAADAVKKAHVSNNSGQNEWYTPQSFIDAAIAVMGGIDLDPASSEIANKTVRADVFHSKNDNGLTKDWQGRVWMNPPYAQPFISQFAQKLQSSVSDGSVSQSITLVNNATETAWFESLASIASAVCFPRSRVRFLDPEGNPGAPLQGQAIIYSGENTSGFMAAFSAFGVVFTKGKG